MLIIRLEYCLEGYGSFDIQIIIIGISRACIAVVASRLRCYKKKDVEEQSKLYVAKHEMLC